VIGGLRDQKGFTLVEIVVAISILTIMLGIAFDALFQIGRTKRALDDERDAALVANAVLGRMTRELQLIADQTALLPPREDMNKLYGRDTSIIG